MKNLKRFVILSYFLYPNAGYSQNQACFDFIKEPVRVCLSDDSADSVKQSVLILDLDQQITLASFESPLIREVSECQDCNMKLQWLLASSSTETLRETFAEGHSEMSLVQMRGFLDTKFQREFGVFVFGGKSFPYSKAKQNTLSRITLSH